MVVHDARYRARIKARELEEYGEAPTDGDFCPGCGILVEPNDSWEGGIHVCSCGERLSWDSNEKMWFVKKGGRRHEKAG
ncbi:hypothetical protein ES708_14728 [subsurface metagenome]